MKTRIILFAAACAALVACSKENAGIDNTSEGTAFKEGQEVTIGVSSGKVSTRVAGTDDGTNINLTWETGDIIQVKVGDKTAEFTLSKGAGTNEAEFTGTMPGGGSSFDIQYPVNAPDLSSQTYEAGKIPAGKMSFSAEGCTLGETASLTAGFSVLQLNLYGAARSVNNIVVTNNIDSKTYTLTCTSAVTVGKNAANATPFYVVVPAGEYEFSVNLSLNELTPTSEDNIPTYKTYGSGIPISVTAFSTSSAQTFTAGQALNMAAKCVTIIWAPVNCGYDATSYKYGKLYQWGRHDGCGYAATWTNLKSQTVAAETAIQSTTQGTISAENEKASEFYTGSTYDWLSTRDNYRWNSAKGDNDPSKTTQVTPTKTDYDPCPDGWRVPTYYELNALIGTKMSTAYSTGDGTIKGYHFGTEGNNIFLPAAGRRQSGGSVEHRGYNGFYWSSSINSANGYRLYFISGSVSIGFASRVQGLSVRCVQE